MLLSSGVRIETGTEEVISDYPSGEMWAGNGPRRKTKHVAFTGGAFHKDPIVTLALSMLDAGNSASSLRVATSVEGLTPTGFTIVVSTWADSKLATVGVTWLAIGE